MRSHSLWALILNLGLASAFQDASPFFLFSTSRCVARSAKSDNCGGRWEANINIDRLANTSLDSLTVASSSQVVSSVLKVLESCPSQTYLFVEQPAARLVDYGSRQAAPTLSSQVKKEDEKVLSSYAVQEVAGQIDVEEITRFLSTQCQAQRLNPAVFSTSLWLPWKYHGCNK